MRVVSSPFRARPEWRPALALLGLVVVRAALDHGRLVREAARYCDWEEAWNASVAWYLTHAGLWDSLFTLQFKSFCGGCTVVAGLAAPLLAVGGDNLAAWKTVALAWTAATTVATFVAVDRTAGRPAAWFAAALLTLPPPGLQDVQLMSWGNHAESALLVAVAVALGARGRPWATGAWLGASVWFVRTSLYGVVAVLAWRVWVHRREPRALFGLGGGLALGLALLLIPAGGADAGHYDLSVAANLAPKGLPGVLDRWADLVGPERVAKRALTGAPDALAWAWLVGVAVAVAAGLAARVGRSGGNEGQGRHPRPGPAGAWVWAAGAGVFALAFGVSGFIVPLAKRTPRPIGLRYFAPWWWLVLVLVAVGAGAAWRAGGARRVAGLVGLALTLGTGGVALVRAVPWEAPGVPLGDVPIVSHARFGPLAALRLDGGRLGAATSSDARTEAWLRRMEGFRAAERVVAGERDARRVLGRLADRPDAVEGFAQALTPFDAPLGEPGGAEALVGAHPELARAIGRGTAANLAFRTMLRTPGEKPGSSGRPGRPRGGRPGGGPGGNALDVVGEAVATLRAGLADGEPCWTCGAAGRIAMDACRGAGAMPGPGPGGPPGPGPGGPPGLERSAKPGGLPSEAPGAVAAPDAIAGCLRDAVAGLADADEVLRGAGIACWTVGHPLAPCLAIPAGPAFAEGLADPTAGADAPFHFAGQQWVPP